MYKRQGAVGLAAAIEYIQKIGFDAMQKQENLLVRRVMDGLKGVEHVRVLGSDAPENHTGIVSFVIDGVHPHDVSEILAADGIAVRAGHHCAQPLIMHLGLPATTRASFMFYNTPEEADAVSYTHLYKIEHLQMQEKNTFRAILF